MHGSPPGHIANYSLPATTLLCIPMCVCVCQARNVFWVKRNADTEHRYAKNGAFCFVWILN